MLENKEEISDLVCYFTFQIVINKGADQTARMCRLVCAFVVRKQQSGFLALRHMGDCHDVGAKASWHRLATLLPCGKYYIKCQL